MFLLTVFHISESNKFGIFVAGVLMISDIIRRNGQQ